MQVRVVSQKNVHYDESAGSRSFPQIRKVLLESKGLDGQKITAGEKLWQEELIGMRHAMPSYSMLRDLYQRSPQQLDLDTDVVRVNYPLNASGTRMRSSPRCRMR